MAAQQVAAVLSGHSLSDRLPPALAAVAANRRPLLQELIYGTIRWQPQLQWLTTKLLRHPLRPRDSDVAALLLVGLYQLTQMRQPPHAVVSETVNASRQLNKPWAAGLLNATLRRYHREQAALTKQLNADAVAHWNHPRWLLQALQQAWPEDWQRLCDCNNQRPPMTLRVDRQRQSRDTYLTTLATAGIEATPHRHAVDGITLSQPLPVEQLPGFSEGVVSVQDGAAQLAALLLAPQSGERILDACAAPGGKSLQLRHHCPDAHLTALDHDPERLQRVAENLQRSGTDATLIVGDAGDPTGWWDGTLFDAILLDAPCSASGIIRRHPDIRLLRRASDIATLAATQARLLRSLWPLLRRGGRLLYVTCSVLPAEGVEVVTPFVNAQADAVALPIEAAWGRPLAVGRQILSGEDAMDGFYHALLQKN